MLETLFSLLGGGALRVVPEILGLMNKKADNAHELLMIDKQIQLEGFKQAGEQAMQMMKSEADQVVALLDANKEALSGQMKPVGIWWVDAASAMVRPAVTYWWVLLYSIVKFSMLMTALDEQGTWDAVISVWSNEDMAILSGILSFWFVGRVFDKRSR